MPQESLAKSGTWITIGNFTRRLAALVSQLVLVRILTPSDYGIVAISYVFWSFTVLFTQFSSGQFILHKGVDDRRYLDTTFTVSLVIGISMAAVLVLAAPVFSIFFDTPELKGLLSIYAVNLVISSAFYTYEGIMLRQSQYREVAVNIFIASLFRVSVTVISAIRGYSYWSFAFGDVAFWLVSISLIVWQSKILLRLRIARMIFPEIIRFYSGTIGFSLGQYANLNADNIVIGRVLGSASLGYYNLAYQLTTSISKIVNPIINRLGLPSFSKLPDMQSRRQALKIIMEEFAYLLSPVYALILLTLDETFISFAFGSQWTSITSVVPFLLFLGYLRCVNSTLRAMNAAQGMPGLDARVTLQIAPISVIGFIFGAKRGGIVGVSIMAAGVLGVIMTSYWWWLSCRRFNWPLRDFWQPTIKPLMAIAISLAISLWLPFGIKQVIFLFSYLVTIRIINRQKFQSYIATFRGIATKLRTKSLKRFTRS